MTDYTFQTITAEQALAYNAANDTLYIDFNGSGVLPTQVLVTWNADNTITLNLFGRVITFGTGMLGESGILFGLPSHWSQPIADPSYAGRLVFGTLGDDQLVVISRLPDKLYGGAGNDTLHGGVGGDVLSGGPGADLFFFGTQGGQIPDWDASDRVSFGGPAATSANTRTADLTGRLDPSLEARMMLGGEIDYAVVQVGSTLSIYADTTGGLPVSVSLPGVSLANFSISSIVGTPLVVTPLPLSVLTETAAPMAPHRLSGFAVTGSMRGRLANLDTLERMIEEDATPEANEGLIRFTTFGAELSLLGAFTYTPDGDFAGGTVRSLSYTESGFSLFLTLAQPLTIEAFLAELESGSLTAITDIFDGPALWVSSGDGTNEEIHGGASDDRIEGRNGSDSLFGGAGDDVIYARGPVGSVSNGAAGSTFLRGEEGDDWIIGGAAFDDAHGNMGDDTVAGGSGDDWVVGGKDNDLLFGDGGGDVVLGNLGLDTLEGGAGDDVVRGGQGDDVVRAGAGNDWVSGDRGTDILSGGSGADNFHVFDGSGVDRVTDFNAAEGDRVWLLPGSQWTAAQVGDAVVVTVTSGAEGGQLVLEGVQLSSLPTGWIFGA